MKIALIAAPGSGKTAVAKRAMNKLNKNPQWESKWKVIDGYVEQLSKRTGLPFGEVSTIPHNLAVITDRWVREGEAMHRGFHTITCGSIYESFMYSSFAAMFISSNEQQMVG